MSAEISSIVYVILFLYVARSVELRDGHWILGSPKSHGERSGVLVAMQFESGGYLLFLLRNYIVAEINKEMFEGAPSCTKNDFIQPFFLLKCRNVKVM